MLGFRSAAPLASTSWLAALFACGAPPAGSAPPSVNATPTQIASAPSAATSAPPDASPATAPAPRLVLPTAIEVFARVNADFQQCFDQGRKGAPKMSDGKVTWLAAVEPSGKTTCVVPTEDSGLTQAVEDCMSARLERENYAPGVSGTVEIPVAARARTIELTANPRVPILATIEEHDVPDAGNVVTPLLPDFAACMRSLGANSTMRVVHVGGRVGSDGRVTCAIASSASPLPPEVRDCAASVLMRARFKPPRSGAGVVSIPMKLLGAKR